MTRINFARRAPLAASAFFIGLCAASGAQAQDAPAQATETAAAADDDIIIVTAQRRTQVLIDVPQSVSVIGGETLDQQNAPQLRRLCAARAGPHPHPGESGRDAAHPARRQHRLGRLDRRHLCRRYAVRRERQPFERRHPRRRFRHVRRGARRGAARTPGNALRHERAGRRAQVRHRLARTPTSSRRAPRSASRTRATARSATSATRWSMSRSATPSPSAPAASIARMPAMSTPRRAARRNVNGERRALAAARRCCGPRPKSSRSGCSRCRRISRPNSPSSFFVDPSDAGAGRSGHRRAGGRGEPHPLRADRGVQQAGLPALRRHDRL